MADSSFGSKAWGWFKFIAIRILFPPIILWDFLNFLIGCIVLPASWLHSPYSQDYLELQFQLKIHKAKEFFVSVDDGVQLSTMVITCDQGKRRYCSSEDPPVPGEKFVVFFLGNAEIYEDRVGYGVDPRIMENVKSVFFNYRGVSQSTGRATGAGDLVKDGIAQVNRLLKQGVQPENITLYGFSLGGGVATLVADHFHKQKQPIYLFNDRSFSSLTNVVVGWFRTLGSGTTHIETMPGKFLGFILKPLIKVILWTSGWEMDVSSAFQRIPEEYTKHVVVRTKKSERNADTDVNVIDDAVIRYYASLHFALKTDQQGRKNNSDSTQKDSKFALPSYHNDYNAHMEGLNVLEDRKGKTALSFFKSFVERDTKESTQELPPGVNL